MAGGANVQTTVSTLAKGYRKKATKLYTAFKDKVEEFSWLDDIDDEEITPSGRENLIPLDIGRGYGAHMVSDGEYEARTISRAMNEGSFSFVQANARFFISTLAKAFDQRAKEAQIVRQIKYQSKKSLEALARRVALQFYGTSSGVVCESTTNATATTQTLTLADGFGDSTIDGGAYLCSLFEVGDRVALLDPGASNALITNALGEVTDNTTVAGEMIVVFDGSVDADANDNVTFANAVTDTTVNASDKGKWPVGLLDIITSTTVHGLATTSEPNWAAAVNNTSGGRFSYVKLKNIRQQISNKSGGKLTDIVWAQGVENDVEAGERAARIYDSSAMDLDGSIKAKGVTFRTSPLCPPEHVFGFDRSGWGKKLLTDKPAEDGMLDFGDLYKAEDKAGWKGGFDLIYALVCRSRGKFARYADLTEQ
jgi:hypothetical protein